MNNRYYANVQGVVVDAIVASLRKANEICEKDADVNCIVLYGYTKNNFDAVAKFFGADYVNKMHKQPLKFKGIARPIQCLTERTIQDCCPDSSVVICCHVGSKAMQVIDDLFSAKYIIAISWIKDELAEWVKRWNAECIYGEEIGFTCGENDNTDLLRFALEEMDRCMCGSKDFHNRNDENTCKTYIRTIHKYMPEISSSQIEDILVTELNWMSSDAAKVGDLLNRLKNGRAFRGGANTGLAQYYKRWKDNTKNS